jgi:3-hydroxyacyl-[acyl-carrier-protein] dehydratase
MRWIWIDRFLDFQRGQSARALKNLSLAEDHFADHFPGYPVMPAALMLEGLAQTGGILVGDVHDFQEKVVLAKIPFARFHQDVLAGERLIYEVELLHIRPEGAAVQGRIVVDGVQPTRLVAEAEIFFAHLDKSRSQQLFGDHNFVFSGELKNLLGLAKILANRKESSTSGSGH